jgi:hypothetical protein
MLMAFFFHDVDILIGDTALECGRFGHLQDKYSDYKYLGTGVFDVVYELVNQVTRVRKLRHPMS